MAEDAMGVRMGFRAIERWDGRAASGRRERRSLEQPGEGVVKPPPSLNALEDGEHVLGGGVEETSHSGSSEPANVIDQRPAVRRVRWIALLGHDICRSGS